MKRVIYPGSFDPVTFGHLDIIERSLNIADELIVGVLNNSAKHPLFSVDERVAMIEEATRQFSHIKVEAFDGLLVDFAVKTGANAVVRGLRAITDFEYELQMSQTNAVLNPNIETVFLTSKLQYAYLSSSIVKEVALVKGDISKFVPENVRKRVFEKFNLKERADEQD
ncbi:MAG: pantetheine-phosphate adenylyltransferase [Lachnospiraceae bacterium]|mgnify:FL=1|nr:pantetheine-phosphate adenylyltransferase [Lachnospiraceae bacterium]